MLISTRSRMSSAAARGGSGASSCASRSLVSADVPARVSRWTWCAITDHGRNRRGEPVGSHRYYFALNMPMILALTRSFVALLEPVLRSCPSPETDRGPVTARALAARLSPPQDDGLAAIIGGAVGGIIGDCLYRRWSPKYGRTAASHFSITVGPFLFIVFFYLLLFLCLELLLFLLYLILFFYLLFIYRLTVNGTLIIFIPYFLHSIFHFL